MTGKIKRRSLRCGGRPKADFGSLFTSVIAPALNAAGSIADESIDNNKTITNGIVYNNTTIPSDPTKTPTMRLGGRKKCWIGAAIGAATSIAGSLFGNSAQKREMRRQQSIRDWQDATQEAANMTSVLNNSRDYQEDYLRQFRTAARLGKTLGAKSIYITDGGNATKIGNNTYLLRGGSHEDVNETGQTGIGINVGGNEVEAEGGEVAQKKNGALRIFSAQPILGNGMSPAQAILRGYNKDSVFSQQQAFKKRNGLKDDGSAKYGFGGDIKSIWNFIRSNRSPIDNIAALATAYQKLNPNSNYNKQKGKFKGGTFRGADAGGTWTNDYKSNKGFDNFNDAYDDAVEHNAKTFIFGNKRYNTLKENNPIREINNRAVGSWRDSVITKDRTGYGKDFGPIKGGASLIPLITETYNPKRIKHRLGGRPKAAFGDWVRTNRDDNALADLLYESGLFDRESWNTMLRDIHTFTGMGVNPYNTDDNIDAVMAPAFGVPNQAQIIRNVQQANKLMQAAKASQAAQRTAYAAKEAKDFYRGLGINIPVGRNQIYNPTFRSSEIAAKIKDSNDALRIYLHNTHLPKGIRLTPVNQSDISRSTARIINPREAEIVRMGIPIGQSAKNMTNGANPFLYTPRNSNEVLEGLGRVFRNLSNKDKAKYIGMAGFAATALPAVSIYLGNKLVGKDNKSTPVQKDAHGKPISQYIAKPQAQQPSRPQGKKVNPTQKSVVVPKQVNKTVAKKERLNRIVGARRVAKALGGYSRPVKSMRPKALGGMYIPFNKRYTFIYDAPDYDSDYNGGNVLGNGEVTVTAKRIKPTFMKPNNDAMNIINHPANETPYIPQRHNRSRTIFSGGDYLGLGIDTLAALSTGLVNYNTAGKYVLPDRAPIIQASKLPTTYNVNPEIEEIKRYRDKLTGQTFNNTSSSVAALNRSSAINLDALSNLSKLWATKENEENKMLTEDAKNQQTIAAQNAQNELARQSEIARIKNEATQAKGDALNVGLSGLSQAWTNFWTAGRTSYEDDQSRRAMIASSKEATPTRLSEMDFDLSPDILASLYRTAKDDRTKRFYLSRLSPKQRQKYGIN